MRTLSVIGLGKLGLPLACVLAKHFKVIGIDKLDWNKNSIKETNLDLWLKKYEKNIDFVATYDRLGDMTFLIVPTPSMSDNSFTSEYIENALQQINKRQIVVIVSTVMPEETERLQKKFPKLTLIYSPTFIALGSVIENLTNPDFILIGANSKVGVSLLKSIYRKICIKKPKFKVLKTIEAEIAKLAINCFITMKITFANQIGNLCYKKGLKPEEILKTVGSDKRIGNKYLRSGLGYGGCCFPRDNKALSKYFFNNRLMPELFKTVDLLNEEQKYKVMDRVLDKKPKTIGFESLSFKEGTDNTECSQLLSIYSELKELGYNVKIGKGDVTLNWWGINDKS